MVLQETSSQSHFLGSCQHLIRHCSSCSCEIQTLNSRAGDLVCVRALYRYAVSFCHTTFGARGERAVICLQAAQQRSARTPAADALRLDSTCDACADRMLAGNGRES